MITVIISIFNEKKNAYLPKILNQFKDDAFFEVICIDGGSTDGTVEWIKAQGVSVHILKASTRAARLNFGIQHATSDMVLLQHPRSIISEAGIGSIKKHDKTFQWAAFTHQFDVPHFFLKFISWYSNQVRVKKKGIVYLDHCILINKVILTVADIPDIAVFEDTALSNALRTQCRPVLLPEVAVTSAVRFLDRGIYKHFLLNQWIKLLYALKVNSKKINRLYEQKLNLNQEN
ncbi:MAG: glycosyltransferase [Gammaproteobacteria bacterium]|nr:glycosyltransferase [Gammaproteobacteria bacterium]MCH9764021.1 glycosyltransferase [Gammaproteobacteria bacterium]